MEESNSSYFKLIVALLVVTLLIYLRRKTKMLFSLRKGSKDVIDSLL